MPTRPRGVLPIILLWFGSVVGIPLIEFSFSYAAKGTNAPLQYHLFWAGMLCALLPAFVLTASEAAGRSGRLVGVVALAAVTAVPKLLLLSGGPLYHDEYPHWREVQAVVETGRLFQPVSIVPIASRYPGLHGLTAAVAQLSGADSWTAGVVVAMTAHLLTLIGVYQLGVQVFGSDRAGAAGAAIYSLNPSYMYFDTQFSYESLAVCYFVWALVFVASAAGRSRRRAGLLAAVMCAACIITHPLTAFVLVLVLAFVNAAYGRAGARSRSWEGALPLLLTVGTAAGLVLWAALVAPQTYVYLSPYFGHSIQQLLEIGARGAGSRALYGASMVPNYERWLAFATPPLLLVGACLAIFREVRGRRPGPMRVALFAFASLYFVSLPFILTTFGAEGARRSWAFTYVGLAMLLAPWIVHLLRRAPPGRIGGVLRAGILASTVVVLVGNVSAGLNADYRFPAPFRFGSGTRTTTTETIAMAKWLRDTAGTGARVVTDQYTGLAVGAYGAADLAIGSALFPVWELYTSTGSPPAALLEELKSSHYRYLIIDKRLATAPLARPYFDSAEPFTGIHNPFSPGGLSKFDHLPWSLKVYQSLHYAIYRFNFRALGPTVQSQ